jgi:hypothetical protein
MTKPFSILAVAFVALGLFLAGCGSSDDDSQLTKAELTKQADAICWKTHNENFDGIVAYSKKHKQEFASLDPQAAVGKAIAAVTVPALQKGTEELKDLAAEAEEQEKVERFVVALDKVLKSIEEDPASKGASAGFLYNEANNVAAKSDLGRCESMP